MYLSAVKSVCMKTRFLLLLVAAAGLLASCKAGNQAPAALDVIMTRTSVRSFTGESLSKEQLETILKAGMAAPSAINLQPWRFVVLTDKDRIAELFGGTRRPEMFTTAGAVILVCGQTIRDGRENIFWYEDCSAATENILLAVHALGLGAVWTAGYPALERIAPLEEALGIPEDVSILSVIPVGVPAGPQEPKDKWKPENIHWEQW